MKEILPGSVKLIDEPGKEFCCEQRQSHTDTHTETERNSLSHTHTQNQSYCVPGSN